MIEIANGNLDVDVYHVEDKSEGNEESSVGGEGYEAVKLTDVEINGDELTALTDGFSLYTVEFTYGNLQYVLEGGETVELKTILDKVGLEVEDSIDDVKSSNEDLFYPENIDGTWYVSAVCAFDSEEWLKVTIDGIEYKIAVTDDNTGGFGGTGNGAYAQITSSNIKGFVDDFSFAKSFNPSGATFLDEGKINGDTKHTLSSAGSSQTVIIKNGYTYFDEKSYDVYIKVIARSALTSVNWKYDGSGDSFIKLQPLSSASSTKPNNFDYEVWVQDGDTVLKDIALVGGSCYTSTSEGARPYSDDGYIYTNIPSSKLEYKSDYERWVPTSKDYDKATYYLLGHGMDADGHIHGGYYGSSGEAEIVLGYLSRDLDIWIDSTKITIKASDGYPIGKNGADYINDKKSEITGWTANKDVDLSTGETIQKDNKIPKDMLQYVIVEEGLELTAITTPSYEVSFDLNYDGHPDNPNGIVLFEGDTYGTLPSPTRDDYTFKGWFTAATGGTEVKATDTIQAKNHTLYAQWQPNSFTITFDKNTQDSGVTAPNPVERDYGAKYGELNPPTGTPTGYSFDGWYTAAEGGTKIDKDVVVPGDITVYAHWKINTYTISFNANTEATGITVPSSMTKNNGAEYGTLNNPTGAPKGYSFDGWYTATTGGTKVSSSTITTDNATLYAHWKANTYKVSFDGAGGTVPAGSGEKDVIYDTTYGTLPTPTRDGYEFDGWYDENGNKIDSDTPFNTDGPVTLYAHWKPISYTVTFDPNGGAVNASESTKTVKFGEKYGTLPTPTYIGYRFEGWYTDKTSYTTKIESTSTVETAKSHTLYARWFKYYITASMEGYVYDCDNMPQPKINVPTSYELPENAVITYYYSKTDTATDGTEWKNMDSDSLNAGDYYIYAVIMGPDGTKYTTATSPFKVSKAQCTVTPPTAINLTYNGQVQALITPGTADGGVMEYSIENSEYETSIPGRTNAGPYDVYYKVVGDENHEDYLPTDPVPVTIKKAPCTVTPPTDKHNTYTGSEQELVKPATAEGGTVYYSLDGENYSTSIPKASKAGEYTVYYKVVPDDNHIGIEPQTVTATISQNARPKTDVSLNDYKYGQTNSLPIPSLEPLPDENPDVKYYIYPQGHPEEKREWDSSIDSKTLDAGDYYIFAEISPTDNYDRYITDATPFKVLKGDYDLTAPTAEYTYGEYIKNQEPADGKAIAQDGAQTEITGTFEWADDEKDKRPKVADTNSTLYTAIFTPSDDFLVNYDPKPCECKIKVNPKLAEPTDLNLKLLKVENGGTTTYEVTEKMVGEVDPVLTRGVDYELTVEITPNKDAKGNITDYDYVITYDFEGNYYGTIIKKINMPVPKPNPEGENMQSSIIARVDREQDVIDDYNPKLEAPDYEWAKKLVFDDFAPKAEDSEAPEAAKKLAEKLNSTNPETVKEVIYDANVIIEVTEPEESDEAFRIDKALTEGYIQANIKNLGEKVAYIDISMFTTYKLTDSKDTSIVFETSRSRITDTGDNEEIITIDIPAELRTYPSNVIRTYYLVRVHEGNAQELPATIADGRITFKTSKFSTYAIAYADKRKSAPSPNPPSGDPADPAPSDDTPVIDTPVATKLAAPAVIPVVIPDADIPKAIAPKTADTVEAKIYLALLFVGVALIFSGRKKKKNCE